MVGVDLTLCGVIIIEDFGIAEMNRVNEVAHFARHAEILLCAQQGSLWRE
jgi:hypothetical protein